MSRWKKKKYNYNYNSVWRNYQSCLYTCNEIYFLILIEKVYENNRRCLKFMKDGV